MLFLINALYFTGSWGNAFDKKQTQNGQFRHENGCTSSVPFMKLAKAEYLPWVWVALSRSRLILAIW